MEQFKLESVVNVLAFSNSGNELFSGDIIGNILVVDLVEERFELIEQAHKAGINALAIHPTQPEFLSASNDYSIHSYNADGTFIRSIQGQTEPIEDFVFSPNGKWMAAIYQDSIIRVISVESGMEASKFIPGGVLHALCFHPNSELLATGGESETVRVFEVGRGTQTLQLKLQERGGIRHLNWSSDGKSILISGDASVASLLDYQSGKIQRTFTGHTGPIIAADLSSKGAYVITSSLDSTVRIFDALSGKNIHTYTGFKRKLNHAVFSPDALQFAYCEGYTIYVHETLSGRLQHTLKENTWYVHDMKFSPDSRYLLTEIGRAHV